MKNKILQPIHPFPARMAPSIVWKSISSQKKKIRILDPMVGSGTTTTISRMLGHQAYGIDTDPLAVSIATAWSSNVDKDSIRKKSIEILKKARRYASTLDSKTAYPWGCDNETKKFISFWFDLKNRKQLTALSHYLKSIRNPSHKIILWTAFSRMIITKSKGVSLAMDISHSRPHKVYSKAPINAFDFFPGEVEKIINRSSFSTKKLWKLPKSRIMNGDSRHLPFQDNFFDMVITSPPYLNAIDYFRASKLSLVWMGNLISNIKKWRKDNIGSEVRDQVPAQQHIVDASKKIGNIQKLPSREQGFTYNYLKDMNMVLSEVARVSKRGAIIIMVIGDSNLKGVYMRNSSALISLASSNGLTLVQKRRREIPPNRRYLPCPSNSTSGKEFQSRMRYESILKFKKAS